MVKLNVVFFGTPAFAVPTLDALLSSRHTVVGVVTQPDRPRGRGQKVSDAPVKARALAAGLVMNVTADKVIRLLPALVIQEDEARQIVAILAPLVKAFLAEAPAAAAA